MSDNKLWKKLIHPEDQYMIPGMKKDLSIGKIVHKQYRIVHKDGSVHWLEAKIIPTLNAAGMLIRIDGICNDISLRREAESKLEEEKKRNHQQVTAAVITAQENEKFFLGEELHENINPILATAKLYIDCALGEETTRKERLADSKAYITLAMNEIRKISKALLPPSLGQIGLVKAIDDMLLNINKANDTRFVTEWISVDESQLNERLKLTVYRILQEQLNNIFKYAHADTVFIKLKQHSGRLELDIHDNGRGFDTSEKRNGVGLQNITSRAELFNGRVNLFSVPGNGCRLNVSFALHSDMQQLPEPARA